MTLQVETPITTNWCKSEWNLQNLLIILTKQRNNGQLYNTINCNKQRPCFHFAKSELEKRWDTYYYLPEFIVLEENLKIKT